MSVIRKEFKTNGTTIDPIWDLLAKHITDLEYRDVLNQKDIMSLIKKLPTDAEKLKEAAAKTDNPQ
jgi:hypothetical protein